MSSMMARPSVIIQLGAAIIIRRYRRSALDVRRGTHVHAAGGQGGGIPEELRERRARGAAEAPAAPGGLLLQRDRPAEHDHPPVGLGQPRPARQVPRRDAGGPGVANLHRQEPRAYPLAGDAHDEVRAFLRGAPQENARRGEMKKDLKTRHGGRILADALVAQGVRMAFGVPGESYLALLDGLLEARDQLAFITCRPEG